MDYSPEHCDRIDPDMPITVLQDESIGARVADDYAENEGLRNSLKEMVQDQAIKPKLKCVMMDPSFSMVTVQTEDSGIVWETASSWRCSPWASEASTTTDVSRIQGSGAAGKITFIMDEDKIIRRKKKNRGKLGEKCKKLPPRPVTSELLTGGDERMPMAEVSVPNVSPQGTAVKGEPTNQKEHKKQDLFCIVSEGIMVPSTLPTVDEEESGEMVENLSYMEPSQMVKSQPVSEETKTETDSHDLEVHAETDRHDLEVHAEPEVREGEQISTEKEPLEQDTAHCPPVSKPVRTAGTGGTDYLQKFTLLDETTPPDMSLGKTDIMLTNSNEGTEATENKEQSASKDPEAFSLSTDVASSHIDEIFYGGGCHDECEREHGTKEDKVPKSPVKESGSALFENEETILTPIILSPGPKIIDPSLPDEPRAMSFLCADLYEEAVGDKKSEECSDVESTAYEKSLHRRLSGANDTSEYLEKSILKDETPVVEDEPKDGCNEEERSKICPESTLELMSFLPPVKEEAMDENTRNTDEITENILLLHEENYETVATDNTGLEDEMLQPPAVVTESQQILQEAVTNHEKSKDKPDEKNVVEDGTNDTENESAENKISESLMDKMTENKESKEGDVSKHVPSSTTVDTGLSEVETCAQKSPILDKEAKQDFSQAMSDVSVDATDFCVKGKEKTSLRDDSSPQSAHFHFHRIFEDNKEIQCALGSPAIHKPIADCGKVRKTVKQKGDMLRLSPLLPVRKVQAEKEDEVEVDSAVEDSEVPSSPVEDLTECCNDTFITEPPEMYRDQNEPPEMYRDQNEPPEMYRDQNEPPEMYRDQNDGEVETMVHEMKNQLEVCELQETETEADFSEWEK